MSELHLIVLWEYARAEEERILADIRNRLELVHTEVLSWPGDPTSCYGRFYGANLPDAQGKTLLCGGGSFRIVIVRDASPRYVLRETSRGLERVNETLFDMKTRYREWTGGGHKVHTTNSVEEAKRDVFLLTGHCLHEWEAGRPAGDLEVLRGQGGWKSLRELFAFLDAFMPYAVLRNAELLPDGFDPSLHGDIDLIVADGAVCASLLGARKVYDEPWRVHYELTVAGGPVRFDFRSVGDGYYDRAWEASMLANRVRADGVNLLSAEDAFYALVYHALYQKREIARDYTEKARTLARAAGVVGDSFDDWLPLLEAFLARKGYGTPEPVDRSVYYNRRLVGWRSLAEEMARLAPLTDLRPAHLAEVSAANLLQPFFLVGNYDGKPCFVKYSPVARNLTAAEWRYPTRVRAVNENVVVRPYFWHATSDGGAFAVLELVEGRSLERLLAEKSPVLESAALVADLEAMADALASARIVHRDVRPANIIVSPDGRAKLIDFQFATEIGCTEEDVFVRRNPRILYALGEAFALASGKWNDRHSIRKCVELLPESAARTAALARLAEGSQRAVRVALDDEWIFRDLRRKAHHLRMRKLRHLLLRRRRDRLAAHQREFLAFADYALKNTRPD